MARIMYVQTSLFQSLKSVVVEEGTFLGTQYIVGSKGVGKSRLLDELYSAARQAADADKHKVAHFGVRELEPIHKEVLEYVGYVPAMVINYVHYLQFASNVDSMKFKDNSVNEVVTLLGTEAKDLGESQNDIRTRTLAILAMNKPINIIEEGWTPGNMIWTCLKASPTGPLIEKVSVVSPLVHSAVVKFVDQSPDELIRVVEKMKQLNQGKLGDAVGRFWERVVFHRLAFTKKIEYFYYDATRPSQHPKAAVSFTGFPYKEVRLKSLSQILGLNTEREPQLLYCPEATSFDFIICDDKGKTHAIQATIEEPLKKCQKDNKFYDDQSVDYKYILTPYEVDTATTDKKNNKLFEAFTLHNLRIIIPSSFLQEKTLNTFRK